MASPRPVPRERVVKNGSNTRVRASSGMPGPLSSTATRHARSSAEPRTRTMGVHPRDGARFGRVANQVAEDLTQQHLVAVHGRERAFHEHVGPGRQLVSQVVERALGHDAQVHARRTPPASGRANFRKFVITWPRASVSCRMPSTYGRYASGSASGSQQPAVAVDRGQAVAEFVRDAGRQLPQPRQGVLEPQLLFQLAQGREVGEQAHDALAIAAGRQRRDAQAQMDTCPSLFCTAISRDGAMAPVARHSATRSTSGGQLASTSR